MIKEGFAEISNSVPIEKKDGLVVVGGHEEGDFNSPKKYTEEEPGLNLTDQKIDSFLSSVKKEGGVDHDELMKLGAFLRNLGSDTESSKALEEKEKVVVSLGSRYINDWFEKRILNGLEIRGNDFNARLAIGTFLVNQMAKVKDLPENEVPDLNKEKMRELLDDTLAYSKLFLDKGRLESEIQAVRSKLELDFKKTSDLETRFGLMDKKIDEIIYDFRGRFDNLIKEIFKKDKESELVFSLFEKTSKNRKVVQRMLSDNIDFASAWQKEAESDERLKSDLEEALRLARKLEKKSKDFIIDVSGEKFDDLSTKYRAIEGVSGVAELRASKNKNQEGYKRLQRKLSILKYTLEHRQSIDVNLGESFDSVKALLENNKSGDFLFLKNLLITEEIARREVEEDGDRVVDFRFDSARFERDEMQRGGSFFSFRSDAKKDRLATQFRFRINRKQIPIMRMMAEMILQKSVERKV